jgi:hypothetical protein
VYRLKKPQFIQNKFVISTGAKRSGEICGSTESAVTPPWFYFASTKKLP